MRPSRSSLATVALALLVAVTFVLYADDSATPAPVATERERLPAGLSVSGGAASPRPLPSVTSGSDRTAAGQRPPQFVVASFDGAGDLRLWRHWYDTLAKADAKATFFLSGTYLLPEQDRGRYRAPGHAPGQSDVGFAERHEVAPRAEWLRRAHAAGHEIGTHYNGHFCGPTGVDRWRSADWRSELRQFDDFLTGWRARTGGRQAKPLPFGPSDIVGGRTPCLEGEPTEFEPVLLSRGFQYDASGTGRLEWPRRSPAGLWRFPAQSLRIADTEGPQAKSTLSIDYSFYSYHSSGRDGSQAKHSRWRRQVLQTYRNNFQAVYQGNRAPLMFGAHFERWNGGAYTGALTDFLVETCGKPEVRCVSFRQLVSWLQAQDPKVLRQLQGLPDAAARG